MAGSRDDIPEGLPPGPCTKTSSFLIKQPSSLEDHLLLATSNSHLQLMEDLIKKRADVNGRDKKGRVALCFTRDSKCIELLLQNNARIDVPDEDKLNPLHHAIKSRELEVVKCFLKHIEENYNSQDKALIVGNAFNYANDQLSTFRTSAKEKISARFLEAKISKADTDAYLKKVEEQLMAIIGKLEEVKKTFQQSSGP